MDPVAAILNNIVLYRYSLVLSLAYAAGICFFMACCIYSEISCRKAAVTALTALVLSLPLSRLVYWYGRPDSFASFVRAMTASSTDSLALAGAFAGCITSAILTGKDEDRKKLLDCMSVAGCFSIALGRLGCFFTDMDRGQIMTKLTGLPWAFPVVSTSGQPEYRFAVFLFQSAVAACLGIFLLVIFRRQKHGPGDVSVLFILIYSASQFLLDSTRYDSLYLRSNGFVSLVQVLSAASLILVLVHLYLQALRTIGWKRWMIPLWIDLAALLGCAGYMEYYVQRHGREAAFAYSLMGACLTGILLAGLALWKLSLRIDKK